MIPHVNDSKEEIIEPEPYYEEKKRINFTDWILLNRPLKVIIAIALTAIAAPLLIYNFLIIGTIDLPPSDGLSLGSCLVSRESRLLCGKGAVTPEECHDQCCYDYNNHICFHRFPSRFSYITDDAWVEGVVLRPRISTVPYDFQESLTNIKLSIDELSPTHLSLSFYKSDEELQGQRIENKAFTYSVSYPELSVVVNGSQGNIFNTLRGPLIASNNIWEITFKLTEESMYGLGEIPLKKDTTKIIYNHDGGLSSIPLIFAKSNGSYHGLLIDTVTPTEVVITSENLIVIRSITNWGLKFHLFVGPKPSDVMRDTMNVLGIIHRELDYWSLGVHVCSEETSENPQSELTTFISSANSQGMPFDSHCGVAPIVFTTECNATHVTLVNQGATTVRNAGKIFMPHVSPHIEYTEPEIIEEEDNIEVEHEEDQETDKRQSIRTTKEDSRCFHDHLYKNYILHDSESNHFYIGEVNNHSVIYPNYENANQEFMQSLWVYDTNFGGIVLENSWPLDEKFKHIEDTHHYLPYFNENFERAFNFTPKWNSTKPIVVLESELELRSAQWEKYIYKHNTYGNKFVKAFEKINDLPMPILTSSQWMNRNITINRQRVPTSWSSLHKELIEASLGGISGHWYWSSPVCGDTEHFDSTTQSRLCTKWYMAAAYMPMIKIHSKKVRRDPLSFVGTNNALIMTAMTRRMSLLPYFYTVLQEGPLLRPMFYQYPGVDHLQDLTTQFSVGDELLIVPNLVPSQTHVHFVKPPGRWYEFWSGMKIDAEEGEDVTMSTTEADFLTLIRGGSIVVMQKETLLTATNTRRQSTYTLIIALDCKTVNASTITTDKPTTQADQITARAGQTTTADTTPETTTPEIDSVTEENQITTCEAKGKLYLSQNLTIIFEANSEALKITAEGDDYGVICSLEAKSNQFVRRFIVYGLQDEHNNFDNYQDVIRITNLCQLESLHEITISLL